MTATNTQFTFISLGWGVQSWTLAAMVALGELPMVDACIHSDTTHERSSTYEFAKKWTPWIEERGVKVVTVSASKAHVMEKGMTHLPLYTSGKGIRGTLRRQCTSNWKIQPMNRHISEELKQAGFSKRPEIVHTWLGITTDEFHRAKESRVKYIHHRYPLLEMNMTRSDCFDFLRKNDLPIPTKSSCVFCPLRSRRDWLEFKKSADKKDWTRAVEVDKMLRHVRPPGTTFIHPSRIPLAEAVNIPEDHGYSQLGMLDDAECDSGYCFL